MYDRPTYTWQTDATPPRVADVEAMRCAVADALPEIAEFPRRSARKSNALVLCVISALS